jgi:hypothetical protein
MTHGTLTIRRVGERRKLFLHTYHTGMDIPEWVEDAVRPMARYNRYLAKKCSGNWLGLYTGVRQGFITSHFGYPPSAAALCIASSINCLEPFTDAFKKDLADWGRDPAHKYELVVEDDRWQLFGPDFEQDDDGNHAESKKIIYCDFNPVERMIDLILLGRLAELP